MTVRSLVEQMVRDARMMNPSLDIVSSHVWRFQSYLDEHIADAVKERDEMIRELRNDLRAGRVS